MCGIYGVVSIKKEVSRIPGRITLHMMASNQNRGKESAGIVTSDGSTIFLYKDVGTATEAVPANILDEHPGYIAGGHLRYSTSGDGVEAATRDAMTTATSEEERIKRSINAHPLLTDTARYGSIALWHNGNLTNQSTIRKQLEEEHVRFETTIDTEVMLMHIRRGCDRYDLDITEAITKAMKTFTGAYSCILMCQGKLYAFRDPYGTWPIKITRTKDVWLIASEDVAWDKIKGRGYVSKVDRGELVIFDGEELDRRQIITELPQFAQRCGFSEIYLESAYTSHGVPQSEDFFTNAELRVASGRLLFQDHILGPGFILPMMDSGLYSAQGYTAMHQRHFAGKSFLGIYLPKNPLVGRAFQEPDEETRSATVEAKYYWNILRTMLEDLLWLATQVEEIWIHCVDDSQVRGTTAKKAICLLKKFLEKLLPPEVYAKIRIAWLLASPPYKNCCPYGIDTPEKKALVAACKTVEEMKVESGADYLGYLSYETYVGLLGTKADNYCKACFNGIYINPIVDPDLIKRLNVDVR